MTCPTCQTAMLLGESGWVCPKAGCDQRIVLKNFCDDPPAQDVFGNTIKPERIKYRKTVEQRGDQIAKGLEKL